MKFISTDKGDFAADKITLVTPVKEVGNGYSYDVYLLGCDCNPYFMKETKEQAITHRQQFLEKLNDI